MKTKCILIFAALLASAAAKPLPRVEKAREEPTVYVETPQQVLRRVAIDFDNRAWANESAYLIWLRVSQLMNPTPDPTAPLTTPIMFYFKGRGESQREAASELRREAALLDNPEPSAT